MRFFLLLAILFLSSCSNQNINRSVFNFSEDMNYDEFKLKLEEYSKNNPYPDINE